MLVNSALISKETMVSSEMMTFPLRLLSNLILFCCEGTNMMVGYMYVVLCLFLDNSDSPSIVEQ